MAFSRFLSVYLPSGPEVEARIGVGVGDWAGRRVGAGAGVSIRKMASIDFGVLLSLIGTPPALQELRDPAI